MAMKWRRTGEPEEGERRERDCQEEERGTRRSKERSKPGKREAVVREQKRGAWDQLGERPRV